MSGKSIDTRQPHTEKAREREKKSTWKQGRDRKTGWAAERE